MEKNRVVITGMGVVSPNANSLPEFEDALRTGKSGIQFISELEPLNFGCRIGGVPQHFEPVLADHFCEHEIRNQTAAMRYATVAAVDAWKDAGLDLPRELLNGEIAEQSDAQSEAHWETGVIIGTGVSDMETIVDTVVPMISAGKVKRMGSRVVEQVMASSISAKVGGMLGLGNQVTSNSSACNTGAEAIVEASWRIRTGRADRMLAGSAEGPSPYTWGGFDAMRVLARKFNGDPSKGSRPMSASACGFVPGSGAGILILENLETAIQRGARIYAEIIGAHVNSGGQRGGGTMTAPNPKGVQLCIQSALRDAAISGDDVDGINGHLTATYADPYEVKNWSAALKRNGEDFPYINSTKSMIGHCLGAAGSIETIAAVLELHHGFLHPSINCEDVHPEIEPISDKIVRTEMNYPQLNIIAKASFGFGDVNSCLILKKWNN